MDDSNNTKPDGYQPTGFNIDLNTLMSDTEQENQPKHRDAKQSYNDVFGEFMADMHTFKTSVMRNMQDTEGFADFNSLTGAITRDTSVSATKVGTAQQMSLTVSDNSGQLGNTTLAGSGKTAFIGDEKVLVSHFAKAQKQHTMLGRWVASEETREIHGRSIGQGFFYHLSEKVLFPKNENPALINESKSVGLPRDNGVGASYYYDNSLGYWPSYDNISVKCRGAYLDWLASTRDNPTTPISYVFIYFSGMEYRVINDETRHSDQEHIAIYQEVVRLFGIYGANHSFAKYTSSFLNYLHAMRPELINDYSKENPVTNDDLNRHLAPKAAGEVAQRIMDKEPIDGKLAWRWLCHCGVYNFKTPYVRLKKEFEAIFVAYFNQDYPSGMMIANNGSTLHVMYEPSNYAVERVRFPYKDMPDPCTFRNEIAKLVALADRCNDELELASRYLAKANAKKTHLEAIVVMPRYIIEKIAVKDGLLKNVKEWAQDVCETNIGLTSTSALWDQIGRPMADPKEMDAQDKKDLQRKGELVILLLEGLGFGVAPDRNYHGDTLSAFESFVVFKGSHPKDFNPSDSYHDAKGIIGLAAVIAKTTDDKACENKDAINMHSIAKMIMTIISEQFELSDIETRSLSAYTLWRLTNNSDTIKLKPKKAYFKVLTTSVDDVGVLIVKAGFCDGLFSKAKIRKAEKVYSYLGCDVGTLSSTIHVLQTSSGLVNNSKPNKSLDFVKVKQYETETRDVAAMLSTVFAAEDIEAAKQDENITEELVVLENTDEGISVDEATDSTTDALDGLDKEHSLLYTSLVEREVWSTAEVEQMCEKLDLMLSGAIETINDWSFDRIDTAVIEEDEDSIVIDQDCVAELSA